MQELVELVLNDLQMKTEMGVPDKMEPTCLEVGCGSGAISLSLLKTLPQVEICVISFQMSGIPIRHTTGKRLFNLLMNSPSLWVLIH